MSPSQHETQVGLQGRAGKGNSVAVVDDSASSRRIVPCATRTPEPHERGEFPMTCYACHMWADS